MTADRSPAYSLLTSVPSPGEVVEVTLLIPAGQLAELERLARRHGLTVAQFLRRHITSLLAAGGRPPRPVPTSEPRLAGETVTA